MSDHEISVSVLKEFDGTLEEYQEREMRHTATLGRVFECSCGEWYQNEQAAVAHKGEEND